jgi:hypothetical protein
VSPQTDKPYSELGKVLDAMARKRDVRGPYAIAKRVSEVSGYSVSGQAVSRYFNDGIVPRADFMSAFARAFDLTEEERDELAWIYTYGSTDLTAVCVSIDPPVWMPDSLTTRNGHRKN